jgi:hypothetical protein
MKIILRDLLTGLYYGVNQTWCVGVSGAVVFDSIQTAASVAQEQKMATVNVVLRYEEPTCELVLRRAPCIVAVGGIGIKGQHPRHQD